MKEPRPTAGSERTRLAHALSEARRTPIVIRSGLNLLGHNRVLMGIVAAEVFWSIGMITFEAFMPLRLEEMVGSAQEAGSLVGPVSAAGWVHVQHRRLARGLPPRPASAWPAPPSRAGCSTHSGPSSWDWSPGRRGWSLPTCSRTRCTA